MCGIVGVIGALSAPRIKLFKHMLVADVVRGKHSTGVFSIDKKGGMSYVKRAVNGGRFVMDDNIDELPKGWESNSRCIIGHNRAATVGSVTTDNAHPFMFNNVVGVHNGTLDSEAGLVSTLADGTKISVDSQKIYATMDVTKPEDIPTLLESLEGAYTLVWSDTRTGRIHMARNRERPLSLGHTPSSIMLASEMGMLTWLVEKSLGEHVKPEYESLPVGEIWSFDPTADNPYSTLEITKFKPAAPFITYKSLYGGNAYSSKKDSTTTGSGGTGNVVKHGRALTHPLTAVDKFVLTDFTSKLSDYKECPWLYDKGECNESYGNPLDYAHRYSAEQLNSLPVVSILHPIAAELSSPTGLTCTLFCVDDEGFVWALRYMHLVNVHIDKAYVVDLSKCHQKSCYIMTSSTGARGISCSCEVITGICDYQTLYAPENKDDSGVPA